MKRSLCVPCAAELEATGKYNIRLVESGRNMKITCHKCKRRRYGSEYDVSKKLAIFPKWKRTTSKKRKAVQNGTD